MNQTEMSINEILTAVAVFIIILVLGLALIYYWTKMENKRIEREYNDSWPSARKKIDGIKQKDLDRLLDYDETERFYHK